MRCGRGGLINRTPITYGAFALYGTIHTDRMMGLWCGGLVNRASTTLLNANRTHTPNQANDVGTTFTASVIYRFPLCCIC
jgi:hypothetical protein